MMEKASPRSKGQAPESRKANTKRKMRSVPRGQSMFKFSWYRISFSCVHTGRYVASTKRRITWKFASIAEGKPGHDECEEHEVSLVWSVKSGKARLFWNGQDITRLFPDNARQKPAKSALEFAWQSAKGTHFKLVAHANAVGSMKQYEFFIDRVPFSAVPSEVEFTRRRTDEATQETSPDDDFCSRCDDVPTRVDRAESTDFAGSCGEMSGDGRNSLQQHSRLAAAGFAYKFDMEDELRSDLYSSTLDFLRDEVASCVPETEAMISRAIINAFSDDRDSDTSIDSSSLQSDGQLDSAQLEANVLGETFEWLKWNRGVGSTFDLYDRKLEYMQKHVELMVSHVRHDRLKVSDASQVIHRVAAILKLEITKNPVADTIMFGKLNSLTTTRDLVDSMHAYGDVICAAVSKTHEGFGFCRFASCDVVQLVCEKSGKGEIEVNGRKPDMFELFSSPYSNEKDDRMLGPNDREDEYDCNTESEIYNIDRIDPSDDGIEATYNSGYRRSLNNSRSPYAPSSFESSRAMYHPPALLPSSPGAFNAVSI